MITGFNTDVEYDEQIFHVQTEDRGRANPIIESLVYTGGEIVDSIRSGYDELAASEEYSEAAVQKRMEHQHKALIRDIHNGKYDPEGPKPFGYNLVSNRSLDEVVHEFLTTELGVDRIVVETEGDVLPVEGQPADLVVRVREESTERPVAGAAVVIKLISTAGKPTELFSGKTDTEGRIHASIDVPQSNEAETAIVCQAEASGANAELKRLVKKADATA